MAHIGRVWGSPILICRGANLTPIGRSVNVSCFDVGDQTRKATLEFFHGLMVRTVADCQGPNRQPRPLPMRSTNHWTTGTGPHTATSLITLRVNFYIYMCRVTEVASVRQLLCPKPSAYYAGHSPNNFLCYWENGFSPIVQVHYMYVVTSTYQRAFEAPASSIQTEIPHDESAT